MNYKKNLSAIKHKLILKAILKASIFALASSFFATSVALLILKLLPHQVEWWIYLLIGGLTFVFSFIPLFSKFYPTKKDIAKAADADNHLSEKVETMLEFEDQSSALLTRQKADTLSALNKMGKPKVNMSIPLTSFIPLIVSAVTLSVLAAVPYRDPSASQLVAEDDSYQQQIDDIISQVDNNSDIEESGKAEIEEILSELKSDLQNASDQEQKMSAVDNAEDKLSSLEEEEVTYDDFGSAMQEEEMLEDLGEAMEKGDIEQVQEELDKLEEELTQLEGEEQKEALEEAVKELEDVLANAGVSSSDEIYQTIQTLETELSEIAKEDTEKDKDQEITDAIEKAKDELTSEIQEQLNMKDQIEDVMDQLEEMKDQMEQEMEDSEDMDSASMDMSGMSGPGGMPSGDSMESMESMPPISVNMSGSVVFASDDLIYDPDTNTYVKYGDLLNTYYRVVNGQISESDLDEATLNLLYEYFGNLFYDEEESTAEEMPPMDISGDTSLPAPSSSDETSPNP